MTDPIKILIIENSDVDVELIEDELTKAKINFVSKIVQSEPAYEAALNEFYPDIILSDFSLPSFDGPTAFAMRQKLAMDVPFIFVSGKIGEERSVEYLKAGVTDYVLKDKMFTLVSKLTRALSEAKEKEKQRKVYRALDKANRLFAFLSEINKAVVHVKDETALFETSCAIAVQFGKFDVAMIGLLDVESKTFSIAGQEGILPEDRILFDQLSYDDNGPQQFVLSKGTFFVCNNISNSAPLQNWKEMAERYGIQSFAVLPIRRDKVIIGTLNLYSSETGFFDKEEMGLLVEIATDISFALDLFETLKKQQRAEALIAASEKSYSDLFQLSPQPMCLYDMNTSLIIQINNAAIEQYGYSEAEFLTMTLMDLVPEEDRRKTIETIISQNRELNKTYKSHSRNIKKDGEIIEVETFSTPIIINGIYTTLVMAVDVTEKILFDHKITKAIIKTQDDERYEIGGELHDNVCQILAGSQIRMGMIKMTLPPDKKQLMEECMEYISLASKEIRNLSHRLAPVFFEESTMEEAFKKLFDTFTIDDKISVVLDFDASVAKHPLSLEVQLNLYRILQEQLRNILKYAQATAVEVDMLIYNNKLKMRIADNGIGFDSEEVRSGIGISNMRRRAELFSGKFDISTSPGNGCTVLVDIPL